MPGLPIFSPRVAASSQDLWTDLVRAGLGVAGAGVRSTAALFGDAHRSQSGRRHFPVRVPLCCRIRLRPTPYLTPLTGRLSTPCASTNMARAFIANASGWVWKSAGTSGGAAFARIT